MVAVPGAREAPVILGTGIGMAMPKMECKINLRGGNQDAWRRWLVNRNDVITAHGLDALMDNQLMPTLEVIGERFPSLSFAERQETLVASTKQYLSENTKLYFLMAPASTNWRMVLARPRSPDGAAPPRQHHPQRDGQDRACPPRRPSPLLRPIPSGFLSGGMAGDGAALPPGRHPKHGDG